MKITIVALFTCIYTLFAVEANSQNAKISILANGLSVQKVISEIEKQTDYLFVYDKNDVNVSRKVSLSANNESVSEVLNRIFEGTGVTYKVVGKNITLIRENVVFNNMDLQQTLKKIRGVVLDHNGEPIIGANIVEKETTNGTITDIDGNFSLEVPQNGTLIVSYIGYLTKEMPIGKQNNLKVTLVEDTQALDEVVVVGYGAQKKVNLTGAVGTIDSKVLESRPIMNSTSALQGTIPNLQITSNSGEPGTSATLNIRGTTSINGGSPLVLVDGVEMNLDMINPSDIANVTVLKDAAASAIYGVRAAYGVILVTTKNAGTDMKTTVSYSGNVAFSKPTVLPDMVDSSWEHAEFVNKAMTNAGLDLMYSPETVQKMKNYAADPQNNPEYEVLNGSMYYYGNSDWVDLMLKKLTPSHRHNVNISGGNEKTKFYSSVGYLNQSGMYKIGNDDYQRLNTRLSVENQTTPWLKLGAKVLYNYTTTDKPHKYKDDVWQQMVFSSPTRMARPWEADSRYPELDQYAGKYFDDQNPISLLEMGGRDKKKTHDVWLTGSADFTFTKDWRARVDFTYNLNYDHNSAHRKRVDMITNSFVETEGNTNNNSYAWTNNNKDYYSFNAYTEYEHTFAEKHYVKGMLGFNQELTKYITSTATRQDLISQTLPSLSLGTGMQTVEEDGYEWALRGGFFRLNYIYDNRYLLEVNGRYDGTSRFPSNNRFVFLPSFSVAWRISEEAFMESTRSWLDNLKVRASYGILGNQLLTADDWKGNTKYYPYIPFMSSGSADKWLFTNTEKSLYINPAGLVSNSLTWEKASTVNVGLDVTLLQQKLDMSFDWYQRTTSDMLVKVEYPEILGTTAPPANMAALRTRGWELSLNWNDRIGKNFTYSLGLILSDSQAEITKYTNKNGTLSDHYVGEKIGEIWGYETEGFYQNEDDLANHADQSKLGSNWAPGDIMYKDLDGNKKIDNGSNTLDDHGDLKIIGNTTPRYQYGITANMSYKNVYMNIFFQGIGKRDYWPSSQPFWPVATQYYNTQKWFATDSWSEDNRDAYFARPIARETKNQQKQTKYLQDASYCRLKNLSVGYDFPVTWLGFLRISKASVYFSAENLFEFTNVKGAYDPEAAGKNGTMVYPFQRTYSFGLNVTF